jgi:hypothetical protein
MSRRARPRQRRRLGTPTILIGALAAVIVGGVLGWAVIGGEGVTVPNVVGLDVGDAVQQLGVLGLEVGSLQVQRDDVDAGTVVAQDPPPRSTVEVGSHVQLDVAAASSSSSSGSVVTPDVVTLPVGDAIEALAAVGLGVETTLEVRDDVAPGTVVGQEPEGGVSVEPGTTVRLAVAQEQAATETIVAWILGLGLDAPQGPPEFQAYELLLSLECQALADGLHNEDSDLSDLSDMARALYGGAAAACLAAVHGQADQWAVAVSAVQLGRPVGCLDAAAYDLLVRLVDAHQSDPSVRIVPSGEGGAVVPPCPTITGLDATEGPTGTAVTVSGTNLDRAQKIFVEYYPSGDVDDRQPSLTPTSFVVPIDGDPGSWACIVIEAANGWYAAGALFWVQDVPGASGSTPAAPGPADPEGCPPPSVP